MRIYVDLDDTLVTSEIDPDTGFARRIFPRPGVFEFLSNLRTHGPIRILTRAERSHADRAIRKLGPAAGFVKEMITREDLEPVEDRVEAILEAPISTESKNVLMKEVGAILPKGVIFDNEDPYTDAYFVKTKAVGVGLGEWIQVEQFSLDLPDLGGLERAYAGFLERLPHLSMKGVHA